MAEPTENRDSDLTNYDPNAGATVSVNPTQGATNPPPPPGATPEMALQVRLNTVKLTPAEVEEWWKRIDASEKQTKTKMDQADILLRAYMPMVTAMGTGEEVKTNGHFRNVHTKIGQLFVKSPKVIFEARGPAKDKIPTIDMMTGQPRIVTAEEAVIIKQSVINDKMGADPGNINGLRLMDECLFDIITWAGLACVKLGYRATMKPFQKPVMQPDPTFVPPPPNAASPLGLNTPQAPMVPVIDPMTGQPQTTTEEIAIYEQWFAERFSPKKLLLPADLSSTRYEEKASWIGMAFYMTKRQAVRAFGIPESELTATSKDDKVGKSSSDELGAGLPADMVEGVEIWYKANCYTDELHPQVVNQLVLIKGYGERARTVVSRMNPDQTIDEFGRLTPDSLIGFPIEIGVVRDLADSAFPPADCAFTNSQVKYQDTFLRQSVKLRDAQIGKYVYDVDAFEDGDLDALKNGEVGDFVAASGNKMANGLDKIFSSTTSVALRGSQDDYRMAGVIKQHMDETLGISSTQAGAPTGTVRSATEVANFQADSQGRMRKERDRAVAFYLAIVRKIDTLVVRYATGVHYVAVEGVDGSKKIEQWSEKLLQFAPQHTYGIKTDSQLENDVARDRQQLVGFLNVAGPDPLVNRVPIYRQLAPMFGINPFEIILDPAILAQGGLPPMMGAGEGAGPANAHESEKSGGKPNAPGSQGAGRGERNPGVSEGKGKPPEGVQ